MVEWITKINGMVNGIVWGPIGLALLFCTGLWMTCAPAASSSAGWAT